MGNNSPSRFRREGRNAFEPMVDPDDLCPYMGTSYCAKENKPHWMDGWKEAEVIWYNEQNEPDPFMENKYMCPFHENEKCRGNYYQGQYENCSEDACPIVFWIRINP